MATLSLAAVAAAYSITPVPLKVRQAIERTMPDRFPNIDLPQLPSGYRYHRWFRAASPVPGHTGPDTVIEYRKGIHTITWTITPIKASVNCREAGGGGNVRTYQLKIGTFWETVYYANGNHGQSAWACYTDSADSGFVRRLYSLWDDHSMTPLRLAGVNAGRASDNAAHP